MKFNTYNYDDNFGEKGQEALVLECDPTPLEG